MNKRTLSLNKFILAFLLSISLSLSAQEHNVHLTNPNFKLVRDVLFSQTLNFSAMPENKVIYLTYWGRNPTAQIEYGHEQLLLSKAGGSIQRVLFHYQKSVKSITFNMQFEPASYDAAYITQHKQQVSVEIPEVYELVNILLALSDKFHQTNFRMHANGSYYQSVLQWFSSFKDHEIFKRVRALSYYAFVENGPAYHFKGERIVPSKTYKGFRAKDSIKPNIELLEDFAKKSKFRQFYQQQNPYYQRLIKTFRLGAKPKHIWQWLERQFPAKYQSYKVFFSPLGPGNNSSRMFDNQNFKQTVMFVSAPNRYLDATQMHHLAELKFMRAFFTEIDHAYVNPVSDLYLEEINQALTTLKPWYKGGGYNIPYLTFNEYMTWSLVSLYALENYTQQEFLYIKDYIEHFMTDKRGFYKFKAFNDEVLRLYKTKQDTQRIVDLYPAIIAWIKKQPAE